MEFLIIGQSVVDKIKQGNTCLVKPGGIFYTVASILSFLEGEDKLYLSTTVDGLNYGFFSFIYDRVEKEFIKSTERIPFVNLIINSSGERDEVYENISEKIDIDFSSLNRFDGILVNMITGFDISIEQMRELREKYSDIIYFDVHTLSRGLTNDFKRVSRPVPEFFKWAECIDIIQANSNELKTLSRKKNERKIVEELMNFGIKQVIITKASEGAVVYFLENGALNSIAQNALPTRKVNEIGCGDVFGAVYFYNYIRTKNVYDALLFANTAAGISTSYLKVQEFLKLKKDVRKQLD